MQAKKENFNFADNNGLQYINITAKLKKWMHSRDIRAINAGSLFT